MLYYKVDVLSALKEAGYNTTRIRNENLLNQSILQYFRDDKMFGITALDKVCSLIGCQPGDLIGFVPDGEEIPEKEDSETVITKRLRLEAHQLVDGLPDAKLRNLIALLG